MEYHDTIERKLKNDDFKSVDLFKLELEQLVRRYYLNFGESKSSREIIMQFLMEKSMQASIILADNQGRRSEQKIRLEEEKAKGLETKLKEKKRELEEEK